MHKLQEAANNIRSLFELHPKGAHFCMAEKQPGYAFDAQEMKMILDDFEQVIRFAAGYISTTKGFTSKHPQEVEQWLYDRGLGHVDKNAK